MLRSIRPKQVNALRQHPPRRARSEDARRGSVQAQHWSRSSVTTESRCPQPGSNDEPGIRRPDRQEVGTMTISSGRGRSQLPRADSIIVTLCVQPKSARAPSGLWGCFELQGFGSKRRRVKGTGLAPLDPMVSPPEPGDLLDHRGRPGDRPIPVAGMGTLRFASVHLVEPVRGLVGSQDGSHSLLGHEQVQARDEVDRAAVNVPILNLLPTTPSIPLQSASPHRRACERIVKVALVL
jgi:hypothetical protein